MSARTVHTPPEPFIRYGCVEFPADVILAAALAPAWVDRAVADQDPMPHVLRSGPVAWSYRPRGPAARYRWGRQRITHDRRRRTSSFRSSAQLAVGLGSAGQRRPQRVRPRSPRRPRLGVRWWTSAANHRGWLPLILHRVEVRRGGCQRRPAGRLLASGGRHVATDQSVVSAHPHVQLEIPMSAGFAPCLRTAPASSRSSLSASAASALAVKVLSTSGPLRSWRSRRVAASGEGAGEPSCSPRSRSAGSSRTAPAGRSQGSYVPLATTAPSGDENGW